MRDLYNRLRMWARDYEPATARALVAAFIQILVVAGVAVGDLPQVADAVLAFVGVAATVLAGRSIRKAVYSPSTHVQSTSRTYREGYRVGRHVGDRSA